MATDKFWVYKITNTKTGKLYIGKTSGDDPTNRITKHFANAFSSNKRAREDCPKLYRSIRKYGKNNFEFEILEEYTTEEEAYEAERQLVTVHNSIKRGLNTVDGGKGAGCGKANPMYGKGHLIAGERNGMYGRTGEKNPFFGKIHSAETKLAASRRESAFTDEEFADMKRMLYNGMSYKQIQEKYDVFDSALSNLRSGKQYKHILPDLIVGNKWKQLTIAEVKTIRLMWESGNYRTMNELHEHLLSQGYSMHIITLRNVLNRISFKNVP